MIIQQLDMFDPDIAWAVKNPHSGYDLYDKDMVYLGSDSKEYVCKYGIPIKEDQHARN